MTLIVVVGRSGPLRLGFGSGRLRAYRHEMDIAGEAADRQPVEKHMGGAVPFEAGRADLKPAAMSLALASEGKSGMGSCGVLRHAKAVASLEVRRKMIRLRRATAAGLVFAVVVPEVKPVARIGQERRGGVGGGG